MDEDDYMDEADFPEPLTPLRKVEIVSSETSTKIQCVECCFKRGLLTCTTCRAVRYCGTECQRKQWKSHKQLCGRIKKNREKVEALAEPLKVFKLLDGRIVNIFKENLGIWAHDEESAGGAGMEAYDTARHFLADLYTSCGNENNSQIAFELAAENMLDLMVLSYKRRSKEGIKEFVPWMLIVAEMDQKAYNYTRYFNIRSQVDYPLPYLYVEDQDIEEDLPKGQLSIHDMTNIALIKYKRMKRLLVDRLEVRASWNNFLLGTDPVVGECSVVLNLRGVSPVIYKIEQFVFGNIIERIAMLSTQVEELLTEVNDQNKFALPGILDDTIIPTIAYDVTAFFALSEHEREIDHLARVASLLSENSGVAWIKTTRIDEYLKYFVKNGKVIDPDTFNKELLVGKFA